MTAWSSPTERRAAYERHIKSTQWRNSRRAIIKLRGNKCERCPSTFELDLHHKTYERLGREQLSDLELLCKACHKIADAERMAQGERRSAKALHNAGMNTYATKKYGEDWQERSDVEQIEEEFDDWLNRQEP
jgi:5-methylcytosine-specific restriction endonuclease McrA